MPDHPPTTHAPGETPVLAVEGASEHHLKDLSCTIPHDSLTIVSGVSGSGKSSLAFDTICREGQRRFLETLSVHARGFLGSMKQPSCKRISGLRPTMAVAQSGPQVNARSTVGTLTDLYDSLRVLFARLGQPSCPICRTAYQEQTEESIITRLRKSAAKATMTILAPIVHGHRGAFRKELGDLRKKGFPAVRVDGTRYPLDPLPVLTAKDRHEIEVVVAENIAADSPFLPEAVHTALELGRQTLLCAIAEAPFERLTTRHACPRCGGSPPEIGPRLFSFNSPYGACKACQGLGLEDAIDPDLLIGDPHRTVREGALVLTTPKGYIIYSQVTMEVLNQVCEAHGFTVDIPWNQLTAEQRDVILNGSDRLKIPFGKHPLESRLKWSGITARPREEEYYKGILPIMNAILERDRNPNILRFVKSTTCKTCMGRRLNPHALAVTIGDRSIADLAAMSLDRLVEWLTGWLDNPGRSSREATVAGPLIGPMRARISRLSGLGLGHLTLDRPAPSLAAGEWQRIRLALQAFTDLTGLLYVLDEPSLGLHPRDQEQLLDLLTHLRDTGNTVLAVEHRRDALLAADHLLDLGPGAGPHGGRLLYQGTPEGLLRTDISSPEAHESLTREWLLALLPMPESHATAFPPDHPRLEICGATQHNLAALDVVFPLARLIAVTGVSGAGKSTLVENVLARHLRRRLHGANDVPGACREIRGMENLDKVIIVDQQPIGRTPRSNPSTYTGVFDLIRDLYAKQPLAKTKGLGKSHFSWNVPGGRCEACQGSGVQEIGLHLLDPVGLCCEECGGKRYLPSTLEVLFRDRSIADVLDLAVAEAIAHFAGQPAIVRILQALHDVGLGYLTLGQSSTTLSGGEAQRVKLASELARPGTGRTLYILDEPATGLHHADITLLIRILRRLVDAGNTVIAVEHHPEFLLSADWLIDLGPEGGDRGGRLVVAGTPRQIIDHPTSHTGKALARLVSGSGGSSMAHPRPKRLQEVDEIRLEGLTTHNLKNLDISIPKYQLTVVTGVSGSGKSTLVMDTLQAECHRRYVESLSAYARRFVQQSERPTLTAAHGLTPVVAIGTRRVASNPRSTIGTLTGSLDLLRLLYSRAGTRHCPTCHATLTNGACEAHQFTGEAVLSARMFSFNHASGACPVCHGMGVLTVCNPAGLITDPGRSLLDGALDGTRTGRFYGERDGQYVATLATVGRELDIDFTVPWSGLSEEAREIALRGCGERLFKVVWQFRRGKRTGEHTLETPWAGFAGLVEEEFTRKRADHRAEAFIDLMHDLPCPECRGERLKPEFREVRWQGLTLGELCRMPIERLRNLVQENSDVASRMIEERIATIQRPILAELEPRLEGLLLGGLGYLTLDRSIATLSGGEFRRVLLASRVGGELTGITYLLDEPTIGLHAQDTARLLDLLYRLRDLGNTVVVVEHDPDVIRQADHVIEIGPGSGKDGGQIMAAGTWKKVQDSPSSLIAQWLGTSPPWPEAVPNRLRHAGIQIRGAQRQNLQGIDIDLPLGGIIALTGVSGSGKTTLIEEILLPSFQAGRPIGCRSFSCDPQVQRVLLIDQQLPSGSEKSLVGTLTGALDPIRDLFAALESAKQTGLNGAAFSPFGSAGRCETCEGKGGQLVDLDFLAGVRLVCEDCQGTRFRPEILDCRYHDRSIADVLAMTIVEAGALFADRPTVQQFLKPLVEIGLGHLSLGRSTDTLSAGERQRLRLSLALTDTSREGSCVFLFDEPTTGLHLADIARLLSMFRELVKAGHSLVIIEHHLDLIRRADWIIDLGPGGGDRGGRLVVAGAPETVAGNPDSATGKALRRSFPKIRA